MKKNIAILGSTGSIGTQALEVIEQYPEQFDITLLTCRNNCDLLIEQARKFTPKAVVIGNETHYQHLKQSLPNVKVLVGEEGLCEAVVADEIDTVLTALVGYAGLVPTMKAIAAGKDIALANKETLVVAGELVNEAVKKHGVHLYPVDSEHSAIFQCLPGEDDNPIEKIYLTASGGPFRGKTKADLTQITKAQALKHPNWEMGAKITIDSASLMNKGLEVIEAKWLFDLKPEQIDVIVHPQSIVHSIVQFEDGSMKAQMGLPDMKLPIQYALTYPQRFKNNFPRFNFIEYPQLTFEQPDKKTFRNLQLAFDALEQGGNMPCILNAANEIMVQAFLEDRVGFLQMSDLIEKCMKSVPFYAKPSLHDYKETDKATRAYASSLL